MLWQVIPAASLQVGWKVDALGAALPNVRGHEFARHPAFSFPTLLNARVPTTQQRQRQWRHRRGQALMGVRGMMGYVQKNFHGGAPRERLGEGDTLVIDGAGWFFEFLEGVRVDHGGDYDAFDEAVRQEVDRLRSVGLRLRVYKDGPVRRMKGGTMLDRRDESFAAFGRLYSYTLDGGVHWSRRDMETTVGGGRSRSGSIDGELDRTINTFPVPRMATRQFYASLRAAGVEIVSCSGEADQELARASASDPTGRTFVLGRDSDYYVFDGCRYVQFNTIEIKDGIVEAPVWTRARLAELCELSEEQVVEWALLMGNDYTNGLPASRLGVPHNIAGKPREALGWLKGRAPEFKLRVPGLEGNERSVSTAGLNGAGASQYGQDGEEGEDSLRGYEELFSGLDLNLEGEGLGDDVPGGNSAAESSFPAGAEDADSGQGMTDRSLDGVPTSVTEAGELAVRKMGMRGGVSNGEQATGAELDVEARGGTGTAPGGSVLKSAFSAAMRKMAEANKDSELPEMEAADLALQFSRALYALEPLDGFPSDEEEDASADGDDTAVIASGEELHVTSGLPPGMQSLSKSSPRKVARSGRVAGGGEVDGGHADVDGGMSSAGGGAEEDEEDGVGVQRDRIFAAAEMMALEGADPELQGGLLRRPAGHAVLAAVKKTLAEQAILDMTQSQAKVVEFPTGVDSGAFGSAHGKDGDDDDYADGEEKEEDEVEEARESNARWNGVDDVEAGARQAALLGVALGERMALPESVRVKWDDVLLAIRYQGHLVDVYRALNIDAASSPVLDESSASLPMPMDHFHGPTFHALLHDYRLRHGAEGVTGHSREAALDSDLREDDAEWDSPEVIEELKRDEVREAPGSAPAGTLPLPIDAHKEEILEHMRTHRVTVIEGETGCGKSSRMPVMVLEDCVARGEDARMFVSQPRRAATRALARRVASQPGFENRVAVRLGHGVREGSRKAPVTFVTTGYLVRLLANNPSHFENVTHLIIDEVHERSIDTDLLCYMGRKLLETLLNLKLILMSATMSTDLVRGYFNVDAPALFVGARRFPVREVYVEDLAAELGCEDLLGRSCQALEKATRTNNPPSSKITAMQDNLAMHVARAVGFPGSAVLIFVPGMASILSLMDSFETLKSAEVDYKVIPFHSDVPMPDLMTAFEPSGKGVVKIVVATNSAESSITLPDVDSVICFGTCKQMKYDPRTQRNTLTPVWISKASAVQRAGRTGRVRPGAVYKLYSRVLGETYMEDHEAAEIRRLPLDSVILDLKNMLNSSPVVPVLESTLEPPDTKSVDRSFASLYEMGLITDASDEGMLTETGRFTAGLGVDLRLGRMVALGARLGVLGEAVAMAAVLSAPLMPFLRANSLLDQDPDDFNTIVGESFLAQTVFDRGMYSDTLGALRLLREYESWVKESGQSRWTFCRLFSLSVTRMQHLASLAASISRRVAIVTEADVPPMTADPAHDMEMANVLRLLLLWTFHPNLLVMKERTGRLATHGQTARDGSLEVVLEGHAISRDYLESLIPNAYAGMEAIQWSHSRPSYVWTYQTPGRSSVDPLTAVSDLWRLAKELAEPEHPLSTETSVLPPDQSDGNGGTGSRGKGSLASVLKEGPSPPPGGRGWRIPGDSDAEGVHARGQGDVGVDDAVGRTPTPIFAGVVYVGDVEEKGQTNWGRDAGSSDVGADGSGRRWRSGTLMEKQKRWCVAVSREFVEESLGELESIVGVKKAAWASKLVKTTEWTDEPVVIDVKYRSGFWRNFRTTLVKRTGGICAALDIPMVRVDCFGHRGPSSSDLEMVFDVTTKFTGGRQGSPSQVIRFKGGVPHKGEYTGLIPDVPLGARILAAMASCNRGRRLRLWSDPAIRKTKVDVDVSLKPHVWCLFDQPGVIDPRWQGAVRAMPVEDANIDPGPVEEDDNEDEAGMKARERDAKSKHGQLPRSKNIIFGPGGSAAAAAIYQGEGELFAVAGSVVWLPKGNGIADGLTLLPPGRSWLLKALLCSGLMDGKDLPEGHGLHEHEIEDAMSFAEAFWHSEISGKADGQFFRNELLKIFMPQEEPTDVHLEEDPSATEEEAEDQGVAAVDGVGVDDDDDEDDDVGDREVLEDEDEDEDEEDESEVEEEVDETDAIAEVEEVLGVGIGELFPEKLVVGEIEAAAPTEEMGPDSFEPLPENAGIGGYFKITPRAGSLEQTPPPLFEVHDPIFYFGANLGKGSPLTTIRRDDALWGGSDVVAAVREAEATVGEVATTLSSGESSAVEGGDGPRVFSPILGEALLAWSDRLLKARRPMASFFAVQAVMMGVLNVHRQKVRRRKRFAEGKDREDEEEEEARGASGAADGSAAGSGSDSDNGRSARPEHEHFGTVNRLVQEMMSVTGVVMDDAWVNERSGSEEYAMQALLEGVPWLTIDPEGELAWIPPAPVAEALDADPAHPWAWMGGIGQPGWLVSRSLVTPEMSSEQSGAPQGNSAPEPHPCLQQFMTYLAYRDDADLANAMHSAGFTHSAWLVLGRIVAAAASLEGLAQIERDARSEDEIVWRNSEPAPASGAPMIRTDLSSAGAGVYSSKGWSTDGDRSLAQARRDRYEAAAQWRRALMRRAEDLAGIPVTSREDGVFPIPAAPSSLKSNDIVGLTPGLSLIEEMEKRKIGSAGFPPAGPREWADGETEMMLSPPSPPPWAMPSPGANDQQDDGPLGKDSFIPFTSWRAVTRFGRNGDAGNLLIALQKEYGQEPLRRVPGEQSAALLQAIGARAEAARFLLDLHCGCALPAPWVSSVTATDVRLDAQRCLDLVVLSSITAQQQRGRNGVPEDVLREELGAVMGVALSSHEVQVATSSVPGVAWREGLCRWDFDPTVVRATLEGEGAEVASLRGFVTRAFNLGSPSLGVDLEGLSLMARESNPRPGTRRREAAEALLYFLWGCLRRSNGTPGQYDGKTFDVVQGIAKLREWAAGAGSERMDPGRLTEVVRQLVREGLTQCAMLLIHLIVLRVVFLNREKGRDRVSMERISTDFASLTRCVLDREGIAVLAGRDLLGEEDLLDFLGRTPGLRFNAADGLFEFVHDPDAIAAALGDPPEIDGWRELVADACRRGVVFSARTRVEGEDNRSGQHPGGESSADGTSDAGIASDQPPQVRTAADSATPSTVGDSNNGGMLSGGRRGRTKSKGAKRRRWVPRRRRDRKREARGNNSSSSTSSSSGDRLGKAGVGVSSEAGGIVAGEDVGMGSEERGVKSSREVHGAGRAGDDGARRLRSDEGDIGVLAASPDGVIGASNVSLLNLE